MYRAPIREPATGDACPGILRLHGAADGHLARVRLPGGRLRGARALVALADAASLGSDIVELTSRGGVQVRGLDEDGADPLAGILERGGLLPSLAHDRVRNILAAPLAGRGPAALAAVDGVLESLDRALCDDESLTELSGRFLFAVDDGTRALEPLRADVELVAEHAVFRLCLDGFATSLAVAPEHAPELALRAARGFLALRGENGEDIWRLRELPGGARRLVRHLGLADDGFAADGLADDRPAGDGPAGDGPAGDGPAGDGPAGDARAPVVGQADPTGGARRLGLHLQRDGLFAVAVLPPLARLDRAQLLRLAELADALACDVRVSPWRTLTFVDVPVSAAVGLLADLAETGLVVRNASGWAGLSACAGLGACARARTDVRAHAARRAPLRDAASPAEHWSGCERRCGEPGAGVRVIAGADGLSVLSGADARTVATAQDALELLERAGAPA
jgi:precorrin-3B synthase